MDGKVRRRARDELAVAHGPPQRPVLGAADANARRDDNLAVGNAAAAPDAERRAVEPQAVQGARDAERAAQLAGTIGEITRARGLSATRAHEPHSLHRFERADEHGDRQSFGACDGIEAPVHAVDEIHVRAPGRPIEPARARRASGTRMAGCIMFTEVGLGFHDASRRDAVRCHGAQDGTKQVARHLFGVTRVERERKRSAETNAPRRPRGALRHPDFSLAAAVLRRPRGRRDFGVSVAPGSGAGGAAAAVFLVAAFFVARVPRPLRAVAFFPGAAGAGGAISTTKSGSGSAAAAAGSGSAGRAGSTTPMLSSSGGSSPPRPGRAPRGRMPRRSDAACDALRDAWLSDTSGAGAAAESCSATGPADTASATS